MVLAQEINEREACEHLQRFPLVDPLGVATVQNVCKSGKCFALDLLTGRLVYVLRWVGNKLLIMAAAGPLKGETLNFLNVFDAQAKANGAEALVFQTARPGLVRLAQKHGYKITGWVLEKKVES